MSPPAHAHKQLLIRSTLHGYCIRNTFLPIMKKLFSLSLFFFLGANCVHASQTLSSHTTLEVRSENPAYSIVAVQHHAVPLPMGAKDTVSTNCLKPVAAGDLQKLHFHLWDRSKSATVASGYCAKAESQVHMPSEIKRLISDFLCVFEDANEIKYENGVNLLHTACIFLSNHSVSIVELILSLNIDVNAQSKYGETALHYLCQQRFNYCWSNHIVAMFDLIVKKGGEGKMQNDWQENPLHVLCRNRFETIPLQLELLKYFAWKKEVINGVDSKGLTPLHVLCNRAPLFEMEQVKSRWRLLIDVKKVAYYRGWESSASVEGIRYLLTHGGQPSLRIQDSNGGTPYDYVQIAGFRTPCVCCGIVCCNQKISLPCFPTSQSADDIEKELLLAVDPLADSVCPKLSYCCWATRTDTKLILLMVASVAISVTTILSFIYR